MLKSALSASVQVYGSLLLVQVLVLLTGHSMDDAMLAGTLLSVVAPLYSARIRGLYRQAFSGLAQSSRPV